MHHVDQDKRNNANTNLVICQDSDYHNLLHQRTRILRAGGNPNTDRLCCDCGPRPIAEFNRRLYLGVVKTQTACRACQRQRWSDRRQKEAAEAKKAAREAAKQAKSKAA